MNENRKLDSRDQFFYLISRQVQFQVIRTLVYVCVFTHAAGLDLYAA